MKTLVCVSPGLFEYTEAIPHQLSENNVIIKIKRVGVCGTDLYAFEGTQPYFNYPRILGHEVSGELIDNSNAPGFQKGEAVTFIPYFNCGKCIVCRQGLSNCCVHIKVFGVHIDGGMAELFQFPQINYYIAKAWIMMSLHWQSHLQLVHMPFAGLLLKTMSLLWFQVQGQ